MKILLLDDDLASVEGSVFTLKETYGNDNVTVIENEEEGIEEATFKYDVIFIDYKFSDDPNRKTGNQVALAIRKKNPISALILMTAYGSDNIRNFIYVGFDDYIAKDSRTLNQAEMFKDAVKNAIQNSQRRLKTRFTQAELKEGDINIKQRLDFMERVFMCSQYAKNVEKVAIGVFLLEKGFTGFDTQLYDEIHKAYELRKEKDVTKTYKYSGKKPFSNSTISEIFKVYAKGKGKKKVKDWKFVAETPALKARQILIENQTDWLNIRIEHATLANFLKDFDLE